uniref:Tetraspanin n=1 Tax=Strix occidentalis caurina TaxID=311401 RepID=A0A8D0EW99_STROC
MVGGGDILGILGGCVLVGSGPVSRQSWGSRTARGWLWPGLCSPLCRDERCRVPPTGVPMGVLSCMKYLMFIFNVLVFAGGTCLAGVGVWVAVDPAGFQDIVAAKPVLNVGGYLLLAVGIALSLLGFLGCCGALRRSRPLLLLFFILVSLMAPILQIQPEIFLSELRRNYYGDEGAEVFSTAWNTLMVTFSCCGVLGPEDFGNGSRFQELHPGTPWPQACCARDGLLQVGELLGWEQCQERSPGYIHEQVGQDPAVSLSTLQKYISVPGTCSLAVLGIEVEPEGTGQAAGHTLLGVGFKVRAQG